MLRSYKVFSRRFSADLILFAKVHAESSHFASGANKEQVYHQILEQVDSLVHGQRNWVRFSCNSAILKTDTEYRCGTLNVFTMTEEDVRLIPRSNLANAASLLWHGYKSLPSPSLEVNWAGPCHSIPARLKSNKTQASTFLIRRTPLNSYLVLSKVKWPAKALLLAEECVV